MNTVGSGARANGFPAAPSATALSYLRRIVNRSQRRSGVALAEAFIRRGDQPTPPPLARMLRGGQGGEVRLKLYLTISLLATNPPHDIRDPIPARSWAVALDLPDPDRNGARRVNSAIDWLHREHFLISTRRAGAPGAIQLLSQTGSGGSFVRPTGSTRYVQLPLGLWRHGWIVRLSGAALAILIILLDMQGARAGPQWISPTQARRQYDLSPDTWTKGIRELSRLGLVEVSRKSQGDVFDYRRVRNAYRVDVERLQAGDPADLHPKRRRSRR